MTHSRRSKEWLDRKLERARRFGICTCWRCTLRRRMADNAIRDVDTKETIADQNYPYHPEIPIHRGDVLRGPGYSYVHPALTARLPIPLNRRNRGFWASIIGQLPKA